MLLAAHPYLGSPEIVAKAVAWCEENGAHNVEEIVRYGMMDAFIAVLPLKTIPRKRLETLIVKLVIKEEL